MSITSGAKSSERAKAFLLETESKTWIAQIGLIFIQASFEILVFPEIKEPHTFFWVIESKISLVYFVRGGGI